VTRPWSDPARPDTLTRLGQVLIDVAGVLRQTGGAESDRLLGLMSAALEALHTAARLEARALSGSPIDPGVLALWLHSLGEPATVLSGWGRILGAVPTANQAMCARGLAAIKRSARLTTERLGQPPG
jgi:hypothetical protein